jgi:threonine aldolase
MSASDVAEKLKGYGILAGVAGARRFRLVTHYWIGDADLEKAVAAFETVLG